MAVTYAQLVSAQSGTNHGTGNYTSSSFSPTAGRRLIVTAANMINSGSSDPSGSMTVSSSGLTWSKIAGVGSAVSWAQGMSCWISSPVPAGSRTVAVGNGGLNVYVWFLSVIEVAGADGTFEGVVARNNAPMSGGYTLTLGATPTADDLTLFGRNQDDSQNPLPAVAMGSGWTLVADRSDNTGGGTFDVAVRTGSTSTSVVVSNIFNASSGSKALDFAAIIKAGEEEEEEIEGELAETASPNTESISGGVAVSGSAAEAASPNTESIAVGVRVSGELSETASQNTEAVSAGVVVSGSSAEAASQNTESLSGGGLVSGAAAETASQNTESIAAGVVVSGSSAETASQNTESIAGSVSISGAATEQASASTEAISAGVLVGGAIDETPSQATESASAAVLISGELDEAAPKPIESISSGLSPATGTITESATPNTESLVGSVLVSGALTEAATPNTEALSGSVQISGALDETSSQPTEAIQGSVESSERSGALSEVAPQATESIAGSVAISGSLSETASQPIDAISESKGPIMGILANSASVTMTTSTDDDVHPGYVVGEMITLSVTTPGDEYQWSTSIPSASSSARSALSSTTSATPRFMPDVAGTYLITVVVDGATVYVLRIGVQAASVAEPIEALRCSPRKDTTVPAPAMGRSVFYSTDIGQLVAKDPSDRIVPLQLGKVGDHLTDADATIVVTDGNVRTLRTSTLTGNRTITLGTSGATAGDSITLIRYDVTAYTVAVVNGGEGEGTLYTFPSSAMWAAEFVYDGTDWALLKKLKVA